MAMFDSSDDGNVGATQGNDLNLCDLFLKKEPNLKVIFKFIFSMMGIYKMHVWIEEIKCYY
jgi:hypothetical protein